MYYPLLTLTLQQYAAVISLSGGVIIVSLALFLIFSAKGEEDKYAVKKKLYKIRGRYFFVALISALILLVFSLRLLPYPQYQPTPDETVTVVGYQWGWLMATGMSSEEVNSFKELKKAEELRNFRGTNEITVPVDKAVRFVVTSRDVTHNFAIYNSKGAIVAQTQAMPQYHNELQYKFIEAGEYPIMCLEYCGMMHSNMLGKIHVVVTTKMAENAKPQTAPQIKN